MSLLLLGALAAFAITTVIVMAILNWSEIVNWFQKWISNHQDVDKDAVGFTVREAMKSGNYRTVQGIFNKKENTVEDARRIESEDLDDETRNIIHNGDSPVTIFE